MLALTRKRNEGLRINDDIQIKVLNITGGSVSFEITAPDLASIAPLKSTRVEFKKKRKI